MIERGNSDICCVMFCDAAWPLCVELFQSLSQRQQAWCPLTITVVTTHICQGHSSAHNINHNQNYPK